MSAWLSRVTDAFKSVGQQTRTWVAGDGQLLVTPFAGRVLGCALPGVDRNLFWHNPAIEEPGRIAACLAAGGAIGGDRLWVAPEVAFMWRDLKLAREDPIKHYELPVAMDPGAFRIVEDTPHGSAGHLVTACEMKLTDHRLKKNLTLRVHRHVDVMPTDKNIFPKLLRVSFAIRNEITVLEADSGAVAGAWDLLQLPAEGWLVCPTLTPVKAPRSYYVPFGDKHVKTDAHMVRFLIDGKRRTKMGLSPWQTTGRMGYVRQLDGDTWSLIVRLFMPYPGEPYVDLPRDSDKTFGGDALQAFNDDSGAQSFGEMEYHEPALVAGRTPHTRCGSCVTHVLAGPRSAVQAAAVALLGVAV